RAHQEPVHGKLLCRAVFGIRQLLGSHSPTPFLSLTPERFPEPDSLAREFFRPPFMAQRARGGNEPHSRALVIRSPWAEGCRRRGLGRVPAIPVRVRAVAVEPARCPTVSGRAGSAGCGRRSPPPALRRSSAPGLPAAGRCARAGPPPRCARASSRSAP